jgi:1-phosphofructokinase family hexose kinase
MILTLTPNPTIDRVIFCRNFALDTVVRAEREAVTPCGKGVNASMVLHELGGDTLVLGLQAGFMGGYHAFLLDELGIKHDLLPAQGETRTLVVLVDLAVGQQSSISVPRLLAGPEHLQQMVGRIEAHASGAWGLICGGSLPPGLPIDSHARLLRCGQRAGLVTLLDSSGEPLRSGVAARPNVLKVNRRELTGLDPDTPADIHDLATRLERRLGTWASEAVIVTLGAGGCLAATDKGVFWTKALSVPVVNTAGAGDALGAGLMLARSRGTAWPAALALGSAAAASVVMTEGTGICRRDQVNALLAQVEVVEL